MGHIIHDVTYNFNIIDLYFRQNKTDIKLPICKLLI